MAQARLGALIVLAILGSLASAEINVKDNASYYNMRVHNLDVTNTLRVRGGSPGVGKLLQGIDTLGNATWWTPTYITGVAWGSITGTLSSQTDLNSALAGKQPLDADLTTLAGGSWSGNTFAQVNATNYSPGAGDNNAITGNAYSTRIGHALSITNSGSSVAIGQGITATGNGTNFSNRNVFIGNNLSAVPRASTGEMTHVVSIGADSGTAADFTTNLGYDNWAFGHAASNIGTHCFNWGFAAGIYGGQWLWNRSGGDYSAILGGLQISNDGSHSAILTSAYVNNGANNNLVFAPNGATTATLSTANRVYLFPHGSGGLILNGTTPTSGYEVDLQSADLRVDGNILQTGLTASRALVSDASKTISSSAVTTTELGYVSGVTSAIQTQLNGKQATGNYITALTGDVTATGPNSVAATIANNAVTNAKFRQSAGNSIVGRASATGPGNVADITAAADGAVLRRASSVVGFGQVDLADSDAITGDLPFANLTQGSARSVLGVAGNATADVASIQGTSNQVLRVDGAGTGLAFGQVNLASTAAVTGVLPAANIDTSIARYGGTVFVPLDGLGFYCRMRGNAAATLADVITGTNPTVNGTPGAAGFAADTNARPSVGYCLLFDGTNDYLNYGNICDIGATDFTLVGWLKWTSSTGNLKWISKGAGSIVWGGYVNSTGVTGSVTFETWDGTTYNNFATTGLTLNDGLWHHAALVWTQSTKVKRIYIDGVLNNTSSAMATAGSLTNAGNLTVGSEGASKYMNGTLDEIMVFNGMALNATQVKSLYHFGTVLPD